jgi:hypothetical protein
MPWQKNDGQKSQTLSGRPMKNGRLEPRKSSKKKSVGLRNATSWPKKTGCIGKETVKVFKNRMNAIF